MYVYGRTSSKRKLIARAKMVSLSKALSPQLAGYSGSRKQILNIWMMDNSYCPLLVFTPSSTKQSMATTPRGDCQATMVFHPQSLDAHPVQSSYCPPLGFPFLIHGIRATNTTLSQYQPIFPWVSLGFLIGSNICVMDVCEATFSLESN
jgi:hypothetical protein